MYNEDGELDEKALKKQLRKEKKEAKRKKRPKRKSILSRISYFCVFI